LNRFKGGGEEKSEKSRDETKGDPFSAKTNWKASTINERFAKKVQDRGQARFRKGRQKMKKRFQRTLEIREMQRQTVVISNSYMEKTHASKSTIDC